MAITKVTRELLSTGIDDNSNATAITIDSSEKVGIGTASPSNLLHISSSTADSVEMKITNTNADAIGANIYLEKDSASPADNDYCGEITWVGSNDNNQQPSFGSVSVQMTDVSDGTEDGDMIFKTNGAGTFAERMRLTSAGRLGLGTASPSSEIHVKDTSGGARVIVEASAANQEADIQLTTPDNGQGWVLFNNSSANQGAIKYNHASDYMSFRTNDTDDRLKIDSNGHVTMPYQSAFLVQKNAFQYNIALGSAVTVTWETEIFDQNADFASNTFTAPVDGKYQMNVQLRITGVDSAHAYIHVYLKTTNRNYECLLLDPTEFNGDLNYMTCAASHLIDMDASDTAYVVIYISGGTAQTDISWDVDSHFSGFLAC